MVKTCSINGCNSRSTLGCGISFHRFPLKNPDQLKEWLKAIGREDWTPTKHHIICSEHFQPSDFYISSSLRKVKPGAVPSLNLGVYNKVSSYEHPFGYEYLFSRKILDASFNNHFNTCETGTKILETDFKMSDIEMKNSNDIDLQLSLEEENERLCKLNQEYLNKIARLEKRLLDLESKIITVKEELPVEIVVEMSPSNVRKDHDIDYQCNNVPSAVKRNSQRRKTI